MAKDEQPVSSTWCTRDRIQTVEHQLEAAVTAVARLTAEINGTRTKLVERVSLLQQALARRTQSKYEGTLDYRHN